MVKRTQSAAAELSPPEELEDNFSTRVEKTELYINAEGKGVIHSSDETFARAFIREVNNDLNDVKHSFFKIGFRLCEADEFEYYKELGYQNITELAEAEFGFKSSTTYNLMRVYALAHDRNNRMCIAENYDKYSYSQLRELVYLKHDVDRAKRLVRPSDNVRAIKKFVANWNKSDLRFDCGYLSDVKTVEDYLNACDERQTEKSNQIVHAGQLPGQMAVAEVLQEDKFSTRMENMEQSERSNSMSDDELIEHCLKTENYWLRAKIYDYWQSSPIRKDFVKFVKDEYGMGGHSGDENYFGVDYSSSGGLKVKRCFGGSTIILSWAVVAGRIIKLIERNDYITDADYRKWKMDHDKLKASFKESYDEAVAEEPQSERSDFSEQPDDVEEPEEDFETCFENHPGGVIHFPSCSNDGIIEIEPEADEPKLQTNREYISTLPDEEFVSELCLKILNVFPMNGKSAAFMSTVKSKLSEWLGKPHEGGSNE